MTHQLLTKLIFTGGLIHFSILVAAALVPFRLNWKKELASLPRLHLQMYLTYGGYVVMAIVAFGCISVTSSAELAGRSLLARSLCGYICIFWGIRLMLQGVFDVKPYLTAWWLRWGYRLLTVLFACLTFIYGWASIGEVR